MNWYKAATEAAVSVTSAEFRAMTREKKRVLAWNTSITQETQFLFFTEDYKNKGEVLYYLARNPSITPEVQPLFITERYEKKDWVLENLVDNPSFLCDFTREQLLQIKNAARGNAKLLVLSKRLEQIVGAS